MMISCLERAKTTILIMDPNTRATKRKVKNQIITVPNQIRLHFLHALQIRNVITNY